MDFQKCRLTLVWGLLLAWFVLPGLALAVNLLNNGNFETFQSFNDKIWNGFPEESGTGWTIKPLEKSGLHFMNSDVFGQLWAAQYNLPDVNYHLEGNYAQAFASRKLYNFVFRQSITATNGLDYAFGGKILTFWKEPDGEIDHTKILKRVGIDPFGGSNQSSPNIVWTDWDGTDNNWVSPAVATTAQSGQVTVFIQVFNTAEDVGYLLLNAGFFDSFKFELAPVAQLNLSVQAAPGPITATWSSIVPDPVFWSLWGYDVELKDNLSDTWQAVQTHAGANRQNISYTFNGQAGRTYTVRVRPWQQVAPNGNPVIPALPGVWQEASITVGRAVVGKVFDHTEMLIGGVTIALSGTNTSTVSAPNGQYALPTGAIGAFEVVANNYNYLIAPPSAVITVPSNIDVGRLTVTMRPTGTAQAIRNNDFETNLDYWGWDDGVVIQTSPADYHTGKRSLRIFQTVNVSQTTTITNMNAPVLSFWYKNSFTFTVQFLGSTTGSPPLTPLQTRTYGPVPGWRHTVLALGGGDYHGPIGVKFSYTGPFDENIFVDEVSIAGSLRKGYIPIIYK